MAFLAGQQSQCLHRQAPVYHASAFRTSPHFRQPEQSQVACRQSFAPPRLQPLAAVTGTVESVKPSENLDNLPQKPAAQQSTVVVTGANSGLGLAAAKVLAKTGRS